jgi:hypothetical protein
LLPDDSKPVFLWFSSTSAVKNACIDDQSNEQIPNPKRISIKGASPPKGASTNISNKLNDKIFTKRLFIFTFLIYYLYCLSWIEGSHLAKEVKYEKKRFRLL